MASGKPIVASDLPSIREVLDEESAYFIPPDDAEALARAIGVALEDSVSQQKAALARELVASYTWSARAEMILRALD
jgi:glycosyltransferase involved in cell wall biosynthesis